MEQVAIVQGAVSARLHGPPEAERAAAAALTVPFPGAQFTQKFKAGLWDGNVRLYDQRLKTFPAGLVPRVAELLRGRYEVAVRRPDVAPLPSVGPAAFALRPYQEAAVQHGLAARRCFIKAPTGTGKTEIGAELIRRIGRPALWLAHKRDLAVQTRDRLTERIGRPVGLVMGAASGPEQFVTVGMVQSCAKIENLAWWGQWEVLVLDECHHAAAETWHELACRCRNAHWRFGLSATPESREPLRNYRLEGATGPRYVAVEMEAAFAGGFLARPVIRMLRPSTGSYPTYEEVREAVLPDWRADPRRLQRLGGALYAEAYRRGVTENERRSALLLGQAARHAEAGEKVLVLCTLLDHGERLSEFFRSAPWPTWWLCGTESVLVRQQALSLFRSHAGGAVLIASAIFQEGVDIPEVDALVLAGGGESPKDAIQRVGRSLRPRPDKTGVLVYDALDGRGDGGQKDYLAQHTASRVRTYREAGFEVREG